MTISSSLSTTLFMFLVDSQEVILPELGTLVVSISGVILIFPFRAAIRILEYQLQSTSHVSDGSNLILLMSESFRIQKDAVGPI